MMTYLWVGIGGFVGANTRYLVSNWVAMKWGTTLPWGTLLINVSGSFLLCFLIMAAGSRFMLSPPLRLALAVGFLGSYTTFSTLSYEWLTLAENGELPRALLYLTSSIVGGGFAGGVGLMLGRLVAG